ncbi:thiamine diphosphate-binding protein [Mucor lusitanicus]|nr:thiamine diphosphate-binding protein [Mucor lusitanicus]
MLRARFLLRNPVVQQQKRLFAVSSKVRLHEHPVCALSEKSMKTQLSNLAASTSVVEPKPDGPVITSSSNAKTWSASDNFTNTMQFIQKQPTLEAYRVMDHTGTVLNADHDPNLPKEEVLKCYKDMLLLHTMDGILYDAQRQGRISFYMTHYGEEAMIGSAAALSPEDIVFGQYREAFMLVYRGFTLDEFVNQCFSNELDYGKGRQMPIHYGSKKLNFQTISSPLGTQIPQASGAAYALKMSGANACSLCFFGEGAASEGDFHAGLNMAATLKSPVIFFCRNNGFAISTPSTEQYKGDGIASRGIGYGIDTIRVDGNDIWAIYNATKAAREMAIKEQKPVLIEAMTYRIGHHSTSDDSTKYRDRKEVEERAQFDNPVTRLRRYLENKNWWSQEEEDAYRKKVRKDIMTSFTAAEKRKKPAVKHLFTDVYDELPPNLVKQQQELNELIKKYPEYYDTSDYASS